MQNSINQRIKTLISKFSNGKISHFAENLGLKPNALYDYTTDKVGNPSYNLLNKIIMTYPSVSANWLLTGKGEMLMNTNNPTTNNNTFNGNENTNGNSSIYSEKNEGVIQAPVTINNLTTEIEILKQRIAMMSEQLEDAKSQIKEKDSQIKEKDSQISKLLDKIIK
jgi:hypothetical protein